MVKMTTLDQEFREDVLQRLTRIESKANAGVDAAKSLGLIVSRHETSIQRVKGAFAVFSALVALAFGKLRWY